MRQIPTSPFPSGGRNPVAEAVSSDNTNLYVVNQDDNTIVQFVIGNDGKLYPQNTVNTPGIYPVAVAVQRIQPLRGGHLPAPAHLLHRRALLRFRCRVSHSPPRSPACAAQPDTLASPLANGLGTTGRSTLTGKPSDDIRAHRIDVLGLGR